jgi:hypothetical protein
MGLIKVISDRAETVGYTIESTANQSKNTVEKQISLGSVVLKLETRTKNAHH